MEWKYKYSSNTHTLHLCLQVVLWWEGDELPSCNVQVHLDVLERWPTPWLGGPADLHQVLEPIRAGGRDGEAEGACPHTVDDGRVLKLLHGRAGQGTMVTRHSIIASNWFLTSLHVWSGSVCACVRVADYKQMFAATWRLVNPQRTGSPWNAELPVLLFLTLDPQKPHSSHTQATFTGCRLETAVSHCQTL